MIYATVNLTIGTYKSTCDSEIVLYRGDKNVEIRFVMKGNKFTVLDSTYAQMIIKRPSATPIFSKPALIQNNTVVLTITEDMIDEMGELGTYTFQIRLYDTDMNASVTLPPCESALIVERPIAIDGESAVNLAVVNASEVISANAISEDEIFNEDNSYNKTIWADGDLITDARLNKIEDALFYINEKGGGGSATAPYISTSLDENVLVGVGQNFNLHLDFSSPNLGKGTLKVFINDVDSMSTKIDQGETVTVIPGELFIKGTNQVVVYVLDRVGMMSNSLTFYARYGSTEISSTFDPYISYDYGSTIRYYFTPIALDTSKTLTFNMTIDGQLQGTVACISDTRSYFTFPTTLEVGNHYCEAWVTDGTTDSNKLCFNLIIIDNTSLVVASDTRNPIIEEGEQLVLDYKVYMKNNSSFIVKTYVDNVMVNTGVCGLDFNYYRTSSLVQGTHTVKVEVYDVTETYSDYIVWTITVTESTYEMLNPVSAGSLFIASAKNRANTDANRDKLIGVNQDGQKIEALLTNFTFNNENGWVDDTLIISGNSWVDIPIQPLADNAKYGFTLDVEFSTKPIGVENAEVLTLWNEEKNCGIKITTEELILRSAEGNQCDLYFTEDEFVSAIFVIDRNEKMAKIYLNGVMCEAFALSDYEVEGVRYLEDFTVNSNLYLGGYNKNGYSEIKNIRVYEVALATDEIINNFISNKQVKSEQRALVEFQKGDTLPTLTVYCDFSGLGKDDKKPCNIVYNSPDENLYGKSFTLGNKTSQLQYQGTSSMAYPIKNYRLNLRDENGEKWKYNPFSSGQPEARFTLKADFMSSGHWQNTGLAKWVNDNLYHYKTNDEKSMNPSKWYDVQNEIPMSAHREAINGFPCRLILVNDGETPLNEGQYEPTPGNTKDMGVFNFNNDKDNVATLGFDSDIWPNCASFEVTANSDTSAGAFMSYSGDGDEADELAYLKESFELRHPDSDDVAEDWGFMGVDGDTTLGLKALIDWVDGCTDEEFVADFEEHFHKDYTLRYYLLVITLGMVDNLGKNMMLDTWDCKIWMPRFYDMDTICSYDNSGQIKFDVDIEMEQGYWNTSASRLWTRIRDLMHDDLVEIYKDMRANGMSYESFMNYFYGQQISQIPQKYYNMDADVKYLPFADEYIGKAHGDGYEHLKRWLKKRLIFTDTLFDYAPSYNNDILTIRANTTEEMTIEIETYTPVYQHVSWYNGQMDKKKIDGKVSVTFSGKAQAATDQEVLIYGGTNIKRIKGLSSMNPNQMLIGGATRLIELEATNCPLLVDINSNKANLSPHTYLNKVDLSGCSQLGGTLRLNNSPLIQEINMSGTAITNMILPSSIRNLESMKLPNGISSLTLNDAGMLNTLEFDEGVKMQSVAMSNCNALTNVVNFDLLNTPTVSLNNSYTTAAELYFRDTTNLTLRNMPNLERVIYTPNNEYEAFELINVANAPDYKVTTFNCPKLSTFMTTAPYRESYNNCGMKDVETIQVKDYGDIQPNTTFTANSIDISSTQFTDVKLLCTTDTNTLKLPTTVKNFYCDSSFDLDTDYLEDGEYDVVHGELVEPYTTDYEDEVVRFGTFYKQIVVEDVSWETGKYINATTGELANNNGVKTSEYIAVLGGSTFYTNGELYDYAQYDKNKELLTVKGYTPAKSTVALQSNTAYIRFMIYVGTESTFNVEYTSAEEYTPNLFPSSADGSLIFSMYAPSNAVAPTSGIWDLKGLEFDNFHTFGMNNDVKPEYSLEYTQNKDLVLLEKFFYNNSPMHAGSIGTEYSTPYIKVNKGDTISLKTSDSSTVRCFYSTNYDELTGEATSQSWDSINKVSGFVYTIDDVSKCLRGFSIANTVEWFDLTINDITVRYTIADMPKITDNNDAKFKKYYEPFGKIDVLNSISMPARYDNYNITIKNADISPKTHNTMLYPLLVNEDNPITGILDYTNYAGKHLSWSFAYTDEEYVNITQPKDELLNSYEYKYNAFYDTEYEFDNPNEIARYTSSASGVLPTFNTEFTYTYDEVDNGDGTYTTKVCANSLDNLPTSISFSGKTTLLTVDKLNTSNVTEFRWMFNNCNSLVSMNAELDTNKVTNAYGMFTNCYSLTNLNSRNWTMPNVTNTQEMFYNCSSLNSIDLSSLIGGNVTTTYSMFYKCNNLTSLDVSGFNTANVTNMNNMFSECGSLIELNSMQNIPVTLDLSSTILNVTSLLDVINNLVTITTTQTLKLGSTLLAILTEDQITIATNKGWTVA